MTNSLQLSEGKRSLDLNDYRNLGRPVDSKSEGIRIDRYLGERFLFRSRTQWTACVRATEVMVNGRFVRPSYKVKADDHIRYFRPPSSEPEVDRDIRVLWDQDGVKAIYKPSNLPMHEGGAYRVHTFHRVLGEKIGREWAAVHRLDRETSGIVLCGNTPELRNTLSAELRKRKMQKTYLAIVIGHPLEDLWDVDAPIGQTTETLFRFKQWVFPGALPSQTRFEVLARGEKCSLLRVTPKTGRTHQIRVHAAWCGYPLVGDKKYNPDETIYLEYLEKGFNERVEEACLFDRLCLHATALEFTHPTSRETCRVESPLPPDMQAIWEKLA